GAARLLNQRGGPFRGLSSDAPTPLRGLSSDEGAYRNTPSPASAPDEPLVAVDDLRVVEVGALVPVGARAADDARERHEHGGGTRHLGVDDDVDGRLAPETAQHVGGLVARVDEPEDPVDLDAPLRGGARHLDAAVQEHGGRVAPRPRRLGVRLAAGEVADAVGTSEEHTSEL